MVKFQVSDVNNSIEASHIAVTSSPLSSADLVIRYSMDSLVHRSMLQKIRPNEAFEPLIYKRIYGRSTSSVDEGPAANALATVKEKYAEIESRLNALASADDEENVERGAVETAISVLSQIQEAHIPPPKITTQDNEAIIMLWAEGMKRCAITITDGEVGYVVRDNRQLLSAKDSISIHHFQLLGAPALK